MTNNAAPITLNAMTDVQGLDRAFARDSGNYVRNTTMFVSGTKDFPHDHWDDLGMPFNVTAESLRQRNADEALNYNPQVTTLVGHSLGGSVFLEMQKNYGDSNFKQPHTEPQ